MDNWKNTGVMDDKGGNILGIVMFAIVFGVMITRIEKEQALENTLSVSTEASTFSLCLFPVSTPFAPKTALLHTSPPFFTTNFSRVFLLNSYLYLSLLSLFFQHILLTNDSQLPPLFSVFPLPKTLVTHFKLSNLLQNKIPKGGK